MFKIGVLASTNGTDLQAIIDEIETDKMPGIELSVVISNKETCRALRRSIEQGYHAVFLDPKDRTREEYDEEVARVLEENEVDLVVLVGYMRILTKPVLEKFKGRIINVHPSLIPKYSGKDFFGSNVHKAVLANHESQTGMTIHYVDEGVDTGEIILQKTVDVAPDDTPETLKLKVQNLEKIWYPEVIRQIAKK